MRDERELKGGRGKWTERKRAKTDASRKIGRNTKRERERAKRTVMWRQRGRDGERTKNMDAGRERY